MKLNSSQLEAFYSVAQTLNFTKSAESLHVTQSALSQRIAKLEDELETTLFIRERTSIKLTEAGNHLLRFCQMNETVESELLSRLKSSNNELAGTVKIAGFSSVNRSLVLPALKKTMQKNPKLSLELFTRELFDLETTLRSAQADYIITNQKPISQDIESIFLGFEDNVLVQAKKYSDVDVFLDHDPRHATTRGYFGQNKMRFEAGNMRYMDDVYGLIDGVKNGFGKAIVPLHLIEDEKDLEIVNPQTKLKVSVYLQFYTQPYYRSAHSVIVDDIKRHFGEKLRQR